MQANKKVLTISIAAYNMEKYIDRCLESVIIPELCSEIDVLVINDGSTDSTLEIVSKYQNKFPNIVRIINKENGGYGSATNTGIYNSIGKYFRPLDADDWFDKDALKSFVAYLTKTNADLIITNYSRVSDSLGYSNDYIHKGVKYEKIYNFKNFSIFDRIKDLGLAMHAMTYRSDILQKNNFYVSDCYYSDADYTIYPLAFINNIVFVDVILYKYYIGREDQSVSYQGLINHIDDHFFICKKVVDFYSNNEAKMNKILCQNIGYNVVNIIFHLLDVLIGPYYEYNNKMAIEKIKGLMHYLSKKNVDLYELAIDKINNSKN